MSIFVNGKPPKAFYINGTKVGSLYTNGQLIYQSIDPLAVLSEARVWLDTLDVTNFELGTDNAITKWKNKGSAGTVYDFTSDYDNAAWSPPVLTQDANGKNIVQFVGNASTSGNVLLCSNPAGFFTDKPEFTCMSLINYTKGSVEGVLFTNTSTGGNALVMRATGSTGIAWNVVTSYGENNNVSTEPIGGIQFSKEVWASSRVNSTDHILTGWYDDVSSSATLTQDIASAASYNTGFRIGTDRGSQGRFMNGSIKTMIMWDRALSDFEMTAVKKYYDTQYGLSLSAQTSIVATSMSKTKVIPIAQPYVEEDI